MFSLQSKCLCKWLQTRPGQWTDAALYQDDGNWMWPDCRAKKPEGLLQRWHPVWTHAGRLLRFGWVPTRQIGEILPLPRQSVSFTTNVTPLFNVKILNSIKIFCFGSLAAAIGRPEFRIEVSSDKRKTSLHVTDVPTTLFDKENERLNIRDVFGDSLQYKVTYRKAKSTGKVSVVCKVYYLSFVLFNKH